MGKSIEKATQAGKDYISRAIAESLAWKDQPEKSPPETLVRAENPEVSIEHLVFDLCVFTLPPLQATSWASLELQVPTSKF